MAPRASFFFATWTAAAPHVLFFFDSGNQAELRYMWYDGAMWRAQP